MGISSQTEASDSHEGVCLVILLVFKSVNTLKLQRRTRNGGHNRYLLPKVGHMVDSEGWVAPIFLTLPVCYAAVCPRRSAPL